MFAALRRSVGACLRSVANSKRTIRRRDHAALWTLVSFGSPLSLIVACVVAFVPALHAQTTPTSNTVSFSCNPGTTIVIDFVNNTVTDSIAPNPVPAVITATTVSWHDEFDTNQYDPHYGNQIVHHVANYSLNRTTGALNGAAASGAVAACTAMAN